MAKKHKYTTVKLGEAQAAWADLNNVVRKTGGTCQVLMSFDDVQWKRNAILLNRDEWIKPRKAPKVIGEVREAGIPTRLAMSPSYAAEAFGF